jgi:hypothetical protein
VPPKEISSCWRVTVSQLNWDSARVFAATALRASLGACSSAPPKSKRDGEDAVAAILDMHDIPGVVPNDVHRSPEGMPQGLDAAAPWRPKVDERHASIGTGGQTIRLVDAVVARDFITSLGEPRIELFGERVSPSAIRL